MPVAFAADLAAMLDRDLRTLRRELEAYPDERQIWQPVPGLPNTAGTLALHLAGNLQHYVGARWGGTGYVRNRDAEFARRDVPRAELIAEIERARAAVAAGLGAVGAEALDAEYPELIADAGSGPVISWCTLPPTSPTTSASSTPPADGHRERRRASGRCRPAELGSARKA